MSTKKGSVSCSVPVRIRSLSTTGNSTLIACTQVENMPWYKCCVLFYRYHNICLSFRVLYLLIPIGVASLALAKLHSLAPGRFEWSFTWVISSHDDVIKWKHFPRNWPFVRGIHRSPVNSPHKDQWRGALMFSLIRTRINGWVNNGEAGDLRRHRANYDVTVM